MKGKTWRAKEGEKQRLWGRQGGECGQEQIKRRLRYPSVPGLEFGQLRKGGVMGQGSGDPVARGLCGQRACRYTHGTGL